MMITFLLVATFAFLTCAKTQPTPDRDGKYTLHAPGISASFIAYGASITNLYIKDRNGTTRDIVLGYDNETTYENDPIHPNYGTIPGRYANRIPNATYTLDGTVYHTEVNWQGNGTIHSGTNGWSYRKWIVDAVSKNSITFSLRDENNSSQGFPGLVLGKVTYKLHPYSWSIEISADSKTHRTPLMLTNHAYWNLDAFANPADQSVLNHTLTMPYSRRMIGFDAAAQPDGSLPKIPRNDINDFWSKPKQIGASSSDPKWVGNCGPGFPGYDCQWLVDRPHSHLKNPIASLKSEWSGIGWDLYSNQEGVVMYSCGPVPKGLLPLKKTQKSTANDGSVGPSGCVAVEPQDWMDGIQYPEWKREKKQIFGPGDGIYKNNIKYVFHVE